LRFYVFAAEIETNHVRNFACAAHSLRCSVHFLHISMQKKFAQWQLEIFTSGKVAALFNASKSEELSRI